MWQWLTNNSSALQGIGALSVALTLIAYIFIAFYTRRQLVEIQKSSTAAGKYQEARIAFFKSEIFLLLQSMKLLGSEDFEYSAGVLQEDDDFADGLWSRLFEMYNRYHVINFPQETKIDSE